MNISSLIGRFNSFQERHVWLAFPVAVSKKYSEDNAGQQAALITYYVFLSLFPALLILLNVLSVAMRHSARLEAHITNSLFTYFPVIGRELQTSIHAQHRAWLSLIIEILIAIYGMRGTTGLVRQVLNRMWGHDHINSSFLGSLWHNILLILVGGVGLLCTTTLSSYVGGVGRHGFVARLLAVITSMVINFLIIIIGLRLCIVRSVGTRRLILGAILTAILWSIVQNFGGFIIAHEFKNSSELYGIFGLVLGLLFWIYLQAKLALYAVEASVVHSKKLWPVHVK